MKVSKAFLQFTLILLSGTSNAGINSLDLPSVERSALGNTSPSRILFVGNSYLYYNDSVHNHVRRLAEELGPHDPDTYEYKSATIGGARLSHHHLDSLLEPGRLGVPQPFELVILQGGSNETLDEARRARFRASVEELAAKIDRAGAEVALYMTHAYVPPHERYEPGMIETIARSYIEAAARVDALVIPVGLAFARAYETRDDISLHKGFDGTHPNLLGTYLAACVVYQSVYGRSVVDARYDYFGRIDEEDAAFLRRIADETTRAFFRRQIDGVAETRKPAVVP